MMLPTDAIAEEAPLTRRAVIAALTASAVAVPTLAGSPSIPKQVLGAYYGWYGTPRTGGWAHWQGGGAALDQEPALHTPLFGNYDSRDLSVINKHLELTQRAGLTGLVASWWGRYDPTDKSTAMLLDPAAKRRLCVSIYIERESDGPVGAVSDLAYIVSSYGSILPG